MLFELLNIVVPTRVAIIHCVNLFFLDTVLPFGYLDAVFAAFEVNRLDITEDIDCIS